MIPENKKHLVKAAIWGGGLSIIFAAISLVKFSPLVAVSILIGAAVSIFNIYSIVTMVEALAGAAVAGKPAGKAAKSLSTVLHMVKFLILLAVLLLLVVYKLTNLFGLAFGFTVVLMANLFAGLSMLKEGAGGD
jgi:ATP synthase I chain